MIQKLIFLLAVMIFMVGLIMLARPTASVRANPISLFEDGFESGGLENWNLSLGDNSKWSVKSTVAHNGTKKASIKGNTGGAQDSLAKAVSTIGYQNIGFSFWYKIAAKLESDNHVFVEWSSDGTVWNQLADFSNIDVSADWIEQNFKIEQAADAGGFVFRFRADLDADSDEFRLDDVILTGEPIVTATPTPSVTSTVSASPTPQESESPTPSPSDNPTATPTPSQEISPSPSPSESVSPTLSVTPTPENSPTPSITATPSPSPSQSVQQSSSGSSSITTPTPTPTNKAILVGRVINDLNGDGIIKDTEPGLADFILILSKIKSGQTPQAIGRTDSDENGFFKFSVGETGNFRVSQESQSGWLETYPVFSFFDLEINSLKNQTVSSDGNSKSLVFADYQYIFPIATDPNPSPTPILTPTPNPSQPIASHSLLTSLSLVSAEEDLQKPRRADVAADQSNDKPISNYNDDRQNFEQELLAGLVVNTGKYGILAVIIMGGAMAVFLIKPKL